MTLLEITTVVVILGTMAALAFPRYQIILEKFKAQEQVHLMLAIMVAQKQYYLDYIDPGDHHHEYPPFLTNLDIDIGSSLNFAKPVLGCGATGGLGGNCQSGLATNFLSCSAGFQPYLVRVKRINFTQDYYLYAHENGTIWCGRGNVSEACPEICPKLGFKY